jgi:hypothetical protein
MRGRFDRTFKSVLADCSKPAADRLQALKFLVHFVRDMHQPLHATDRWDAYTGKDEQGGNLVPETFIGQATNLSLYEAADTNVVVMDQPSLLIGLGIVSAAGEGRPWRSDFRQPCRIEVPLLCPSFSGAHLQGTNSLSH